MSRSSDFSCFVFGSNTNLKMYENQKGAYELVSQYDVGKIIR